MLRRVVIVGGGVAALELVIALRRLAEERVAIEVVTPERQFVYRPLAVAEPFGLAKAHSFELDRLLSRFGATRREAAISSVDSKRHIATTADGDEISYGDLVVAVGARPFEAIRGALTVGYRDGFARLSDELARLRAGDDVVVAIPGGSSWTLPAYELALMTRVAHPDVGVSVVTPEEMPLAVFGRNASAAVAGLLAEREIAFHPESQCVAVEHGALQRIGASEVPASLVIAMPGLEGPHMDGLPGDGTGFIPVDGYGRVAGLEDVYAAGDATTFPIKQGGLAAQQAVVVAKMIASRLGVPVTPAAFEPVLRGLLLTGSFPAYLRADIAQGMGVHHSEADTEPIWWPPSKIATEHLSHLLAVIAASEPLPSEDPFLRLETDDIEHLLQS